MGTFRQQLVFLLSLLVFAHAMEKEGRSHYIEDTEKHHHVANGTEAATKEVGTSRKNPFSGLGNMLGAFGGGSSSAAAGGSSSAPGGTSPVLSLQQGLQGIQNMQRFIVKLQSIMKHPFSFRGVSDTMATLTGLLAAVGGGYLTYVSMVALFGNMMDPQNTAHQYAYSAPPHQYAPPQHLNLAASHQVPAYNRRQSNSDSSNFFFGSYDIGKMLKSVTNFNYPEASFQLLRIKEESCKQRAVCEFEKFLAKKGIASVILKGVSKKIPGMEKYLDAAYRGLANEDCGYAFNSCPYTLGQSVLRSIGLN
ncbi:uncharacterized protein LOC129228566 [Uloborus diversus]|uniref:uncharacterized protein LOC129228566 n=1 Tax=Uloborus diversus TaxID=327109 RepID=UPI0024094EEB|nr:uncharacterized protein LOC129228566 [Uloborus diversus]